VQSESGLFLWHSCQGKALLLVEVHSGRQVVSFCEAEPGCRSLTLCGLVLLLLVLSFDSLEIDFVHFIKHTSVNHGGGVLDLFSKQTKKRLITFFFCYFVLCFAFLLDILADVD